MYDPERGDGGDYEYENDSESAGSDDDEEAGEARVGKPLPDVIT
jgi:hypothetical protein